VFVSATLTKSLANGELDGLFFEILRQLLSAIFRLQEDEEATETDELEGKPLSGLSFVEETGLEWETTIPHCSLLYFHRNVFCLQWYAYSQAFFDPWQIYVNELTLIISIVGIACVHLWKYLLFIYRVYIRFGCWRWSDRIM